MKAFPGLYLYSKREEVFTFCFRQAQFPVTYCILLIKRSKAIYNNIQIANNRLSIHVSLPISCNINGPSFEYSI